MMKVLVAVFLVVVLFQNVLTYENDWEASGEAPDEIDLLDSLKRALNTETDLPTTESPLPDDDDKDDDDDDKERPEGLLHKLRGSCDIISAAGPKFFSRFPEGPVWDHFIEFTPDNFTEAFSMFMKVSRLSTNKRVYIRSLIDAIGFRILRSRMMCPGVKLQQAVMYILRKELNLQLEEEDGTLYSDLLAIYHPIFPDMAEAYAHGSVRYAHGIIFEEIIDYILRSELGGLTKMADKLGMIIRKKLSMTDMTMPNWMRMMKFVLRKFQWAIQCPTPDNVLKVYNELVNQAKLRFADDIIKKEAMAVLETLMRENMDFSHVTDPKQFLSDVMGVFERYGEKLIARFNELEQNINDGTLWKMENFIRRYLDEEQMRVMSRLIEWLFPDNGGTVTTSPV